MSPNDDGRAPTPATPPSTMWKVGSDPEAGIVWVQVQFLLTPQEALKLAELLANKAANAVSPHIVTVPGGKLLTPH